MNDKAVLFKNISVVTPTDSGVETFDHCHVSVEHGQIQYCGYDLHVAQSSLSDSQPEIYPGENRILLPCLVNAHTHLAMTLLRNRADDIPLQKWLFDYVFPIETKMGSREYNAGTLLGVAEMIRNGIGACANMYMTTDDAMDSQTAIDTGIKMNTVLVGGHKNPDTEHYVLDKNNFERIYQQYHNAGDGRIQCGLLVHSVYLYNESFYYELAALAESHHTFIHIHISETQKEVDDCINQYGARPPQVLEKMGILDNPVIGAHCVFLDDNDREILKRKNVTVVHNPTSNLKLGSGIADLKKLLDANINVALGTDGPASNNNLDIYQEMRLASYLAKGIHQDPCIIPAGDIIRAATLNGMVGLGFNNSGMIKKGMDADLQIINTNNPGMSPIGNKQSAIVYSMSGHCVESLMVSGKMLMKNRELLTIDEEKAIFEARISSDFLYN